MELQYMCVLFYSLLDMIGSKIRKCYCATLSLTLLTSVYVHKAHVIMTLHGIDRYYYCKPFCFFFPCSCGQTPQPRQSCHPAEGGELPLV